MAVLCSEFWDTCPVVRATSPCTVEAAVKPLSRSTMVKRGKYFTAMSAAVPEVRRLDPISAARIKRSCSRFLKRHGLVLLFSPGELPLCSLISSARLRLCSRRSWIAVTGNRNEMYQSTSFRLTACELPSDTCTSSDGIDCASVFIEGSGTSTLDDLPDMFVGDMSIPGQIGAGECRSSMGAALEYPNPGAAVTTYKGSNIPFKKATGGKCFPKATKINGIPYRPLRHRQRRNPLPRFRLKVAPRLQRLHASRHFLLL